MSVPSFDRPVELDVPGVTARTIFVDTLGINATYFGISRGMQDQLYENGRAAATKFLASSGH